MDFFSDCCTFAISIIIDVHNNGKPQPQSSPRKIGVFEKQKKETEKEKKITAGGFLSVLCRPAIYMY